MTRNNITRFTMTAVLTALIFVIARFLPSLPLGNSGYVNLGDTFIYAAVLFLPTPYAVAAGALGAALSDLTYGYALWVIPTLIVKTLIILLAKAGARRFRFPDLWIAASGVAGVIGYYLAEVILIRFFIDGGAGWRAAFAGAAVSIWGNVLQAVVCGALYYLLAKAARRVPYLKEKIKL